ncbi:MAG: hypothetical protein ACOVRP_12505 [Gemmatimonas sp.]
MTRTTSCKSSVPAGVAGSSGAVGAAAPTPRLPVEVRFAGRPRSHWLARFADLYLNRALQRFRHRVVHALLRVRDVNGKRGGVAHQCSVALQRVDGQGVFLRELAATPKEGVMRLSRRAQRVLVDRRRPRERP